MKYDDKVWIREMLFLVIYTQQTTVNDRTCPHGRATAFDLTIPSFCSTKTFCVIIGACVLPGNETMASEMAHYYSGRPDFKGNRFPDGCRDTFYYVNYICGPKSLKWLSDLKTALIGIATELNGYYHVDKLFWRSMVGLQVPYYNQSSDNPSFSGEIFPKWTY